MLSVNNLEVFYGAIQALHGVSLEVQQGEIVTLIGANGAGKSTTLRTVSGLIRPKTGTCEFKGKDITRVPAHKIVQMGLVQVPEGRKIFPNLTVRENLLLGAYTLKDRREIANLLENVFERFPRLKERQKQEGGTLSGGEQQMLAMGRGLMANPALLILDEPSMGLSPILVEEIFKIIQEINAKGTTVLLVEQNAFMALQIAHRAYVLETGTIMLSGSAADLQANPKIRSAYLGDLVEETA
ncbi:MAG TPA: ABC transporter ATP-binding protein [Spirochaetia bacterium]|nr:ABC transporter ATP-binding protein [Spirochaetia bacterium]